MKLVVNGRVVRGAAAILCLLLVLCVWPDGPRPAPAPPSEVGFSFSPKVAASEHLDPVASLGTLLWRLRPDLVRLPVYWDEVAPSRGRLDFTGPDRLIKAVADYDHGRPRHHTKVVLVVGARNLAAPELHMPGWAWAGASTVDLSAIADTPAYLRYLETAFSRYRSNPLLAAWQVENEPLDNTNAAFGQLALPPGQLEAEIQHLREIDSDHPVVVTTFDSSHVSLDKMALSRLSALYALLPLPRAVGSPFPALQLGDVLGLDVYVVTPSTSLADISAAKRIGWKRDALAYWSNRAAALGKSVWITEMQAAPWEDEPGFTEEDLLESAQAYRLSEASVVLLWGVEYWLQSPDWMQAGISAINLLRS